MSRHLEQSGGDLHCKWLRGWLQKSVYPQANSLKGPDHLGQSVKNGGTSCPVTGHLGQNRPRWLYHKCRYEKSKIRASKAENRCGAAMRWTWSLLTHGEAPTLPYSTNERWQLPFDLTSSRWLRWETPKSICIIKSCSICEWLTQRASDSELLGYIAAEWYFIDEGWDWSKQTDCRAGVYCKILAGPICWIWKKKKKIYF